MHTLDASDQMVTIGTIAHWHQNGCVIRDHWDTGMGWQRRLDGWRQIINSFHWCGWRCVIGQYGDTIAIDFQRRETKCSPEQTRYQHWQTFLSIRFALSQSAFLFDLNVALWWTTFKHMKVRVYALRPSNNATWVLHCGGAHWSNKKRTMQVFWIGVLRSSHIERTCLCEWSGYFKLFLLGLVLLIWGV